MREQSGAVRQNRRQVGTKHDPPRPTLLLRIHRWIMPICACVPLRSQSDHEARSRKKQHDPGFCDWIGGPGTIERAVDRG
jgi:hypothetical protein